MIPTTQPCILLVLFYNGAEEEGRANFKALYDIGELGASVITQVYRPKLCTLQALSLIIATKYPTKT